MIKKLKIISILCFLISFLVMPFLQEEALSEDSSLRNATIKDVAGSVKVKRERTSKWEVATRGMVLNQNDTIKTGNAASADIAIPTAGSQSLVHIYNDTEITLNKLTRSMFTGRENTVLGLPVGKILIKAAKLEGESKFEVATPTSLVGVRGTEFEVIVSATED